MQDWWALLAWYENVFVWPLAIGAFLLLLTAKSVRRRVISALLLVLVFLPHIQKAVGDVYFDYLCKTQAGEFIYRTVDNVEGILQMRPRDGSKDYFDRMRVGDIPEDPWGHTNLEARRPWGLIGRYQFIETMDAANAQPSSAEMDTYDASMFLKPTDLDKVVRFLGYNGRDLRSFRKEFSAKPKSQYGFVWSESRSPMDRLLNVYPGEVVVRELATDETLGLTRGFLRVRPIQACPSGKDDFFVTRFIEKVLKPIAGHSKG